MNNLDEDIKILEEFTESSCCLYGQEEIIEATKNVLSELKKKNKRIENLQGENELQHCDLQNSCSVNNGLKKELETYKELYFKALATGVNEARNNHYKNNQELDLLNEGWKIREKELLGELETYKKIAEKLAEKLQEISNYEYDGEGKYYCEAIYGHCKNTEEPFYLEKECKKCLLDWARKEVEKDDR